MDIDNVEDLMTKLFWFILDTI